MTSDEIRKVTFEKSMRGYRAEDVDDFLQQVAKEIDTLTSELEAALADKESAEAKMYVLAEKVEEYRGQEETLKTALINAQRMGETVVHEAKQKADTMVREATGKAELLRQSAEQEILAEQTALESMQAEVSRFKATILNLYKQHIESLSALDAPVEHVNEFLAENSRKPSVPAPEAAQPEETVEEQPLAGESTVVFEAEEASAGKPLSHTSAIDLFEGVPIDVDIH